MADEANTVDTVTPAPAAAAVDQPTVQSTATPNGTFTMQFEIPDQYIQVFARIGLETVVKQRMQEVLGLVSK